MSGKASDVYRRRVAKGLCRDCGGPRGATGTAHRCASCARAVAAEKRLSRLMNALRVLFGLLAEESLASRSSLARRPLRLRHRGRIRILRTESGRPVTHEDVLRALLGAWEASTKK